MKNTENMDNGSLRGIMNILIRVLILIGSASSVGFGVWHLFVPKIWKWYSYIQKDATELILAVRAINVFFSVSLILFGLLGSLITLGNKADKYASVLILSSLTIIWLLRVIMQIVYPQGSLNKYIQYGMLSAFFIIFLCYAITLIIIIKRK